MSHTIAHARALKYGGVTAWLAALSYPTKFAPLRRIASSALMAGGGVDEDVAFYTHSLFYEDILLVVFWWRPEQSTRQCWRSSSLSKNIGLGFDTPLYRFMVFCPVCTVPTLAG